MTSSFIDAGVAADVLRPLCEDAARIAHEGACVPSSQQNSAAGPVIVLPAPAIDLPPLYVVRAAPPDVP